MIKMNKYSEYCKKVFNSELKKEGLSNVTLKIINSQLQHLVMLQNTALNQRKLFQMKKIFAGKKSKITLLQSQFLNIKSTIFGSKIQIAK